MISLPFRIDGRNTRGRRTSAAPRDHVFDLGFVSFKHGLDLAGREVSHPAGQVFRDRLFFGGHPVANALDPAGNEDMNASVHHATFLQSFAGQLQGFSHNGNP